jgi:hypothetical protein
VNPLRRIALITGLAATLTTGAALAATGDTATKTPAPDPYLGSWSLSIDGNPAGPVTNVDGCRLRAQVVEYKTLVHGGEMRIEKTAAGVAPEPCSFQFGQGMSAPFYGWLNSALSTTGTSHAVTLTRIDGGKAAYALELTGATVAELTLPKVDRAVPAGILVSVSVGAQSIRRVAAKGTDQPQPVQPFPAGAASVALGGVPVDTATLGAWTAESSATTAPGVAPIQGRTKLGDVELRVPEAQALSLMDPWMQGFLVDGKTADERPLTITLRGGTGALELAFGSAGLAAGDLGTRADGDRTYSLYVERLSLNPLKS